MFQAFLQVVREARPRFFVMENLRGVLSAAVKHRPLLQRGSGHPPLTPEEELGSAFALMLQALSGLDYHTVFDLLTAADFGVPQVRERLLFIGSRDGEPVAMPSPTHAKKPADDRRPWVTLREGLAALDDPEPVYEALPTGWQPYLKRVPAGGNWRDLPEDLQRAALGKAYDSWGGRGGFFRRLSWDRPAPALTTNPGTKATMLCHPTELRPLSVREYARLQQFPDDWQFGGGTPQLYLQIGNAVPVGLGQAVGEAVLATMRHGMDAVAQPAGVTCENVALRQRLLKRPKTRLNPPRMRKVKDLAAAKAWMKGLAYQQLPLAASPADDQTPAADN